MNFKIGLILINLLMINSVSCQNSSLNRKESQKIKTIYQIITLIKSKNYIAIKQKYGNDYFLKSETDFEIKVDQAADLINKYGTPSKNNISFKYENGSNPNSLTTTANVLLVNQDNPTDNIKNVILEFIFIEGLGSEKIVDFNIDINTLLDTPLPPLQK